MDKKECYLRLIIYIHNSVMEITNITLSENYSMANYNNKSIVIIKQYGGISYFNNDNNIALIFNVDTFQIVNHLKVNNLDFIYNSIYYYYYSYLSFNPPFLQEKALILKSGNFWKSMIIQ